MSYTAHIPSGMRHFPLYHIVNAGGKTIAHRVTTGLLTGLGGLGRESPRPGLTKGDIHVFFSSVPMTQRCLSRQPS